MNLGKKGSKKLVLPARSILLAGMLLLLALWFGWSGISQWRQSSSVAALEQARGQALAGVEKVLSSQLGQLQKQLANEAVKTALAAGDAAAAAAALRQGWAAAEDSAVLPASLEVAYQDLPAFGYAKLALLELALSTDKPTLRIVRADGGQHLGVAAPVLLAEVPAVAYVRVPITGIETIFASSGVPASAYLALRQGTHQVIQQGDGALSGGAEAMARPVGNSGLRVAASAADIEPGPLGLRATPAFVVAVLLLFVAVALVVASRKGLQLKLPKRKGEAAVEEDTLTLQEALAQAPRAPQKAVSVDGEVAAAEVVQPAVSVPADIFRAYDIRGVVGTGLTPAVAELIGQAIGSVLQEQGLRDIVVGRDGRLSSPEMSESLIQGLRKAGCDVFDIGLAPTPVVYFAAYHLRSGSCVAVTGSHNPPDYNGFKIVVGGETLSGTAITDLHARISEGRLALASEPGALQQREVMADYVQRISHDVQLDRPLKVVADAGNGAAGVVAEQLLEAIGAEVIPLYCDVDGSFPNHHPDPSDLHNLEDLIQTVKRFDADLGLAFDGDADRLGVVTREGKVIFADRLLMLFAGDVLQRNPGALVIYDVKCTGQLSDYILRNGGSPMMWKTGHSLIKAKMRETDAELAGEMSGHFFFKERWYGFDDGLYAAARLLEILSQRDETPSEVFAELPESISTPEIKVPVDAGTPHALVSLIVSAAQAEAGPFSGGRLSTIDGLRVDFPEGWGLVRASNTTPVLVLRFEASSEDELARIKALFREQLQIILPRAELDF